MYTPPAYAEKDAELLRACMRQWSFAKLVTHGAHGVQATHLRFLVDEPADEGGLGTLVTHLARGNAQFGDLQAGAEALVLFQGPHAFISPSWYENRHTFPTWNYTAVHARGQPELIESAKGLLAVLDRVVAHYDTPLGGPRKFRAMPSDFAATRLRAIVALRIPIASLEGKMKMNQDKSVADRRGVIAALEKQGDAQSLAVARLIRAQPDMQAG